MPSKAPLRIHFDSYWLHFEENLLSSFIYSAVFIDPEKKNLPPRFRCEKKQLSVHASIDTQSLGTELPDWGLHFLSHRSEFQQLPRQIWACCEYWCLWFIRLKVSYMERPKSSQLLKWCKSCCIPVLDSLYCCCNWNINVKSVVYFWAVSHRVLHMKFIQQYLQIMYSDCNCILLWKHRHKNLVSGGFVPGFAGVGLWLWTACLTLPSQKCIETLFPYYFHPFGEYDF